MAQKKEVGGKFEFVTLAGARARQLLAGCTPRSLSNTNKPAKLAQQEVREGKVERSIPHP
jgi:DNA-directed RNA polymerase subunit K/omega